MGSFRPERRAVTAAIRFLVRRGNFLPWRAFGEAVKAANWPVAAKNIGRIRLLIVVNLILGTAAVVVGASGRYYG